VLESYQVLKARLPYGVESPVYRVRESLVGAFATAASWLPDTKREAITELIALLRDSVERTYSAAANGLAVLKATEAIPAIEALQRLVPEQKAVDLDRIIRRIRASADTAKSRKELEDLQSKVAKLSDQLQDLQAALDKKTE